jgi:hypothetical protein
MDKLTHALLLVLAVIAATACLNAAKAEECASGYVTSGEVCVLRLPQNATANPRGGWSCNRGFYDTGGLCLRLEVPPNASLSRFGHNWECNPGYQEVDRKCVRPGTARISRVTARGGLPCAPGAQEAAGACAPPEIPHNARLSADGGAWLCNSGFQEREDKCVPLEIPRNAHLGTGSDTWVCNRGYRPVRNKCLEIDIPNNASLGFFGDVWSCNRGYYELRGVCLPDTKSHRALVASAAAMFAGEPAAPASGAVSARRAGHVSGNSRALILAGLIGMGIGGVLIFLMREPPVRYAATYKMNYVPRPRGSGLSLIWRPFGHRIDALTGASIDISTAAMQCRNCRAWYHPDSAATLRRENTAKCVACGRAALTPQAA